MGVSGVWCDSSVSIGVAMPRLASMPAPTLPPTGFLHPTIETEAEKSSTTMAEPLCWSRPMIVLLTMLSIAMIQC